MTAKDIAAVATSVRCLTMDAVEKAKSGTRACPWGARSWARCSTARS